MTSRYFPKQMIFLRSTCCCSAGWGARGICPLHSGPSRIDIGSTDEKNKQRPHDSNKNNNNNNKENNDRTKSGSGSDNIRLEQEIYCTRATASMAPIKYTFDLASASFLYARFREKVQVNFEKGNEAHKKVGTDRKRIEVNENEDKIARAQQKFIKYSFSVELQSFISSVRIIAGLPERTTKWETVANVKCTTRIRFIWALFVKLCFCTVDGKRAPNEYER